MDTRASGVGAGERRLNGIQTSGREYRNLSEPQHEMEQVDDVAIAMRDGVTLLADVYRPTTDDRYPALLSFAAYPRQIQNLRLPLGMVEAGASDFFVPRGYVHVTSWLEGVPLDRSGFILTDTDLPETQPRDSFGLLGRQPLVFETSIPGLFAAGDVRHGSMKRIAAAVAEGSSAIRSVHQAIGK